MRPIRVKVTNDVERDAVLTAFGMSGGKWRSGKKLTEFVPPIDYPYCIDRSCANRVGYCKIDSPNYFGSKMVSIDRFRKFIKPKVEITIYSDGKTVRAVGRDGSTGVARCSPEDEFSLEIGAKLAIDRMRPVKVGDRVRVEDSGKAYTTFSRFFEEHDLPRSMAARYEYGNFSCQLGDGTVIGIYRNEHDGHDVAVIETAIRSILLVGVEGLRKV